MALLFIATVLLWATSGLIRIYYYFFPVRRSETKSHVAIDHVSKTDAITHSAELREFYDDISTRMSDAWHAFENYVGRVHELQMCLEHDEERAEVRYGIKPEKMGAKLVRDVRDRVRTEETTLLETARRTDLPHPALITSLRTEKRRDHPLELFGIGVFQLLP